MSLHRTDHSESEKSRAAEALGSKLRAVSRSAFVKYRVTDLDEAVLFPEEIELIQRAKAFRRREFSTTRQCARDALAELGVPPVPIAAGDHREPIWPAGIVGSLTHCDGMRASVVAAECDLTALGIDAERNRALPVDVLEVVATPHEANMVMRLQDGWPHINWDTLLFSAKESVYKAWYPRFKSRLSFHNCLIQFSPSSQTFRGAISFDPSSTPQITAPGMRGVWALNTSVIMTSAYIRSTDT